MVYIEELDPVIFCFLQQILYYINLYIDSFKSFRQRLEETENTNPTMQIVIKITDPIKQNRGTNNYSTSIKVTGILIGKDDSYMRIIK